MKLLKFSLIDQKESQTSDINTVDMLINIDHLITVKPINMLLDGELVRGYWVRLSNGKKYRATKVPVEIEMMFGDENSRPVYIDPNIQKLDGEELYH